MGTLGILFGGGGGGGWVVIEFLFSYVLISYLCSIFVSFSILVLFPFSFSLLLQFNLMSHVLVLFACVLGHSYM